MLGSGFIFKVPFEEHLAR